MIVNGLEICEELQSKDRKTKIAALEMLQYKCLDTKDTPDFEIQQIFDEIYLYLLNCYSDRFESVRDQAIRTVSMFIERLPPNEFLLVNIVSTLAHRMGQEEAFEESEEIRLAIMKQLFNLAKKFITTGNHNSMHVSYNDIFRITIKALKDSYPAVQKEACACIVAMFSCANTYEFQPFAENLAKGLYEMLNHKHSQARIAAVKALAYVALHVNDSENTLSQLIMEVSPLLMDSIPLVRRECGELGVKLLLELRDRYSYFEKLIPLVLCCLKDDSPEVQTYIFPLWEKCGKQYYDENEAELSKQEIADIKPLNYPKYLKRPSIGCRAIVQRSIRILKLIMRESNNWKENVRLHSFKLLYQFILHAEAAMTTKFFEIYGDLARALRDVDPSVVQEAVKVSDLLGRLLNYEDWCECAFEGLEKSEKEGYLKCFYYMYTASCSVKSVDNIQLSEILTRPEFSQTLNSSLHLYVLKTNETILEKCEKEDGKNSLKLYSNCYCSTIKVMSLSLETDNDIVQTKATKLLLKISDLCKCNIDDLHEQFLIQALQHVQNINAPLDALSEPILLLCGLIKLAKFRAPYLKEIQRKINIVFDNGTDKSKVKLFCAISVAMLDWNKSIQRSITESVNCLMEFSILIIEPHIGWKAGASAEAMRSLAAASLCALSQGASVEATKVLPYFAKYMPSLLEDKSVSTRHYSIKCLYNFGELNIDHLKPIAYGCLQRLNDPSSNVRVFAASVIPKLQLKLNKETDNTNDSNDWLKFMKYCFDILYMHYDNPEKDLQVAIRATIIDLSRKFPEITRDSQELILTTTND